MKKIFFLIILALICKPAFATTYYIDTSGSDSNNGTSTGTAWADCVPLESVNFNKPGDRVLLKDGDTWSGTAAAADCYIYSAGNPSSHIAISDYGGGATPILDASVDESTVSGWTGWTNTSGTVYESNVTVPWSVNSVMIDGTYSLRKLDSYQCTHNTIASENYSFCQSGAGTNIYVNLANGANPGAHTIRFSEFGTSDNNNAIPGPKGHARGQFGIWDATTQYIDVSNINLVGSSSWGFTSGSPYNTFTNCTSFASANEGFYISSNDVQNSQGAAYNQLINSLSSWANSNFGQQISIESPHVDVINTTSENGWMAGMDSLRYNASPGQTGTQANPTDDRYIGCISHDNGQRAWQGDYNGFDAYGWYFDGASNQQLIDSIAYESPLPAGISSQNALYALNIGNEHPTYNTSITNIDVIGSLFYGSIGYDEVVVGDAINCSGNDCKTFDNIRFIGDTISGGNGGYQLVVVQNMLPSLSAKGIFFYDCIFNEAGTQLAFGILPDGTFNFTSDYNDWYSDIFAAQNIFPSTTLAQWQTASGQDMHSQWGNPLLTGPYTFTVTSANATAGATYTNSSITFTVLSTISGQTTLTTTGNNNPAASGTLTKASGTGDATITYSTYTGNTISGVPQNFHLSATAAGQGTTSPAIGAGENWSNIYGTQYVFSNFGTVRTDSVADSTTTPAEGYHYGQVFTSSYFPTTATTSTID